MTWNSPTLIPERHGSFIAYSVECLSGGNTTSDYRLKNVTQVTIDQCLPYKTYNCCVSLHTTLANSTEICQQQRTLEEGKWVIATSSLLSSYINFVSSCMP